MNDLKFDPDYSVHPMETLRECLEQRVVTEAVPRELVDKVLEGEVYSYEEAKLLADGTPYGWGFWVNMQTNHLSFVIQEDGKHL